jgi:hypothetical protein
MIAKQNIITTFKTQTAAQTPFEDSMTFINEQLADSNEQWKTSYL